MSVRVTVQLVHTWLCCGLEIKTSYSLLDGQTWRGLGASLKNQCQTLVVRRTCTRGWHRAYTTRWTVHTRSRTGNLGWWSVCYRNLSSKRTWALAIDGPKNVNGRLHRQSICTYNMYVNHRIVKKGGWALTRRCALTRENMLVSQPLRAYKRYMTERESSRTNANLNVLWSEEKLPVQVWLLNDVIVSDGHLTSAYDKEGKWTHCYIDRQLLHTKELSIHNTRQTWKDKFKCPKLLLICTCMPHSLAGSLHEVQLLVPCDPFNMPYSRILLSGIKFAIISRLASDHEIITINFFSSQTINMLNLILCHMCNS